MREREGGESQKAFDMREAKLETLRRRGEEVQQIKRDAFYLGGCDIQEGEGRVFSSCFRGYGGGALSVSLPSPPRLRALKCVVGEYVWILPSLLRGREKEGWEEGNFLR